MTYEAVKTSTTRESETGPATSKKVLSTVNLCLLEEMGLEITQEEAQFVSGPCGIPDFVTWARRLETPEWPLSRDQRRNQYFNLSDLADRVGMLVLVGETERPPA